ncbi:MAG: helix-turn-helix transcriptional regulator, partial [Verrucomicrobiales bacterium]
QRAMEPYQNTPFEKPLANVFQKISEGLRDKMSISLDQMDGSISFKSMGLSNADIETFQLVTKAVATEQELEFQYRGYSDRAYKKRRIQPWHLCCVDNQWYLIGHDLMRKAKRTFLLVRMRKVALTGEPFERPRDFELKEHLRDSFGVFAGKDLQRVRIEFRGAAARLVQEKSWHPTQVIKDLGEGRIEYSVKLGDLFEIERWILGWGGEARVISPAKLKNRIRKHAEAILAG